KTGVSVGRAAQRECAAYLLDHGGWAGVPHTAMLWVLHTAAADGAGAGLQVELKSGSFQRFVPHSCTAEELGARQFAKVTTQRVACFDIRVCNSDRCFFFLFFFLKYFFADDPLALTVVPIDHGFILPHYRMLGELNFEWASWPQASEPLSETDVAYVSALDSHADAAMLRIASSLPEECLLSLHLGTALLQLGVAAGLTLAQIALLAVRGELFFK
ncbi:hypothetical protein T492DRAFT_588647, partial [Pavlovales sp. CCMP2436]